MLELTDMVVIREVFDKSLDIAADGIRLSVFRAYDTAILAIGSVTMTLDDKAILNLKGPFRVIGPFGYLPCFAWGKVKRAFTVWTMWIPVGCYAGC
jgi:hypothetical protein